MDSTEDRFEESEILEPLHTCLRELLARDEAKKTHLIEYTDADVIAAHLMYTHIMGNRLAHRFGREKVPINTTTFIAKTYAEQIRLTTKQMAQLDIAEYYKRDRGISNNATI